MIIFLAKILLLLSFKVYSEEVILNCKINKELENGEETFKRVYQDQNLKIYLDRNNFWLNDIKYNDWVKINSDQRSKIETNLREYRKSYSFELKEFDDLEKKNIESSSKITLEKFGGSLEFTKFYYDYNQRIFFSTEVRGICIQN